MDNADGEGTEEGKDPRVQNFGKALMIGIAFAANIGGTATLTGTPPNIIFNQEYQRIYRVPSCGNGVEEAADGTCLPSENADGTCNAENVDYGLWLAFAFPTALLLLVILNAWMAYTSIDPTLKIDTAFLREKLEQYPPYTNTQIFVLCNYGLMVILWIFRDPGWIGEEMGWTQAFPEPDNYITDATIAFFCLVILFLVPSEHSDSTILESYVSNKHSFDNAFARAPLTP